MTRATPIAAAADRHALYRLAVQAPERDARMFARWFRAAAGRPARLLREDFGGTAAIAACFVRLHRDNRAIAVDHDARVLRWAETHERAALTPTQRARLQLVHADVRAFAGPRVDLVLATNFSYCVLQERRDLLGWLRAVRARLRPRGMLVLDVWGGGLTHRPFAERTRHRGFTHVWETRAFDPISHRVDCRIHFEFADGSALPSAFVYDWRLWTLPELRDVLAEAGFARVDVRWQDAASGEFRRRRSAPPDPAWLAFVTAQRP